VRKQQYDLAIDQLNRAKHRVDAGDAPPVEILRAESGVGSNDNDSAALPSDNDSAAPSKRLVYATPPAEEPLSKRLSVRSKTSQVSALSAKRANEKPPKAPENSKRQKKETSKAPVPPVQSASARATPKNSAATVSAIEAAGKSKRASNSAPSGPSAENFQVPAQPSKFYCGTYNVFFSIIIYICNVKIWIRFLHYLMVSLTAWRTACGS
jgi:hypothetical protein